MFNALVLSLPTRNSTLRMRVWRALKDCGSAVLRDGVYLLPASAPAAALGKLESEIRSHGGFAMTLETTPNSRDQPALRGLFDRTSEYGELVGRIAETRAALARLGPRRGETAVKRLEQAFSRLAAIDFFPG
jgi:hypothetical protein